MDNDEKILDQPVEDEKGTKAIAGLARGIGKAASDAKAVATKAQEVITDVIDVNDDGKVDISDFGKIAVEAGKGLKRGGDYLSKVATDAKLVAELKQLRPVFPADLLLLTVGPDAANPLQVITRPGMIRIVDRDKKHDESKACVGSVGYWTLVKGMEILNLYEDRVKDSGLQFFPAVSKTFYYANPCQPSSFISLDEYFQYMKIARISELEMIAKDLGAKRFAVVFKEQEKTFVKKGAKGAVKVSGAKAEASYEGQQSTFSGISIAAQSEFSGHDHPIPPKLVYFKNESDIEKLVEMRMDATKGNQLKAKTYTLQYNKTSGIKIKEAASIDAVLSQMKCSGTATISSEAQNESRFTLEYTIEF